MDLGFGGLTAAPGDHIGHFYRNSRERLEILVPYLKTGLDAGEHCVYHIRDAEARELRDALVAVGVDLDRVVGTGQLDLSPGRDSLEGMRGRLQAALNRVPDEFPSLRFGGDMTWSFDKIPDTCALMELESIVNGLEKKSALYLCQYDLSRFIGSVVIDAMKTHPITVVGNAVHENPYYEDPEEFLKELRCRDAVS